MKVWILFLLVSFFIGISPGRGRRGERRLVLLGLCCVVTVAFYSYRWV